jgi:hypothetical protein
MRLKAIQVREQLARGQTVLNGWSVIPGGFPAEVMASLGWDALTIDMQHGMIGYPDMLAMLQTVSTTPLVRLAANDATLAGQALDAGAMRVICPRVSTPPARRSPRAWQSRASRLITLSAISTSSWPRATWCNRRLSLASEPSRPANSCKTSSTGLDLNRVELWCAQRPSRTATGSLCQARIARLYWARLPSCALAMCRRLLPPAYGLGCSWRNPGARMVSPGFSLVAMSGKFGSDLAAFGS